MHPMQLRQRVPQQIKHLSLLTFHILRMGLPHTTPYAKFQRAAQEYSSLFVTYTTGLWSVRLQQELARWANSALPPWLKRGDCGAALLSESIERSHPADTLYAAIQGLPSEEYLLAADFVALLRQRHGKKEEK